MIEMKPLRSIGFRSLVTVFLLLVVPAGSAFAGAGTLTSAPLNPEFIRFQQEGRSALDARGPDGRPLGYRPSPLDLSHVVPPDAGIFAASPTSLPSRYDLRQQDALTLVRDQGSYGTCWAFASLASLESTFKKVKAGSFDLSEWHLAYFAYQDQSPSLPSFTRGTAGYGEDPIFDQGGNQWQAAALLSRWTGAVNESDRPYQNRKPWPESSRPLASDPVFKHLEHVLYLPVPFDSRFNSTPLKQAIMTHGAAYISISPMSFEAFNSKGTAYYNSSGKGSGGHAVAVVGWDDNYPASNFKVNPGSNGAWLIRNSWGTSYHDGGYFWISYRDQTIRSYSVFKGGPNTNFSRIYQYDPLGWVDSAGYNKDTAWFANIFTAIGPASGSPELLKAVSFYAAQSNSAYRIEVRKGVNAGSPRSGTLAYSAEGTLAAAGYHTVRIPSNVSLAAGERFSIVIRLRTPGYNFPIPTEYPLVGYSTKARAAAGQSFISSDGSTWGDLTTYAGFANTNVCLKAFTSLSTQPQPPQTGSVKVTIKGPAQARWRLFVEHREGASVSAASKVYKSGETAAGVPEGSAIAIFSNVTGWNTPAARLFTVTKGKTSALTVSYTRKSQSGDRPPLEVLEMDEEAVRELASLDLGGVAVEDIDFFSPGEASPELVDLNDEEREAVAAELGRIIERDADGNDAEPVLLETMSFEIGADADTTGRFVPVRATFSISGEALDEIDESIRRRIDDALASGKDPSEALLGEIRVFKLIADEEENHVFDLAKTVRDSGLTLYQVFDVDIEEEGYTLGFDILVFDGITASPGNLVQVSEGRQLVIFDGRKDGRYVDPIVLAVAGPGAKSAAAGGSGGGCATASGGAAPLMILLPVMLQMIRRRR